MKKISLPKIGPLLDAFADKVAKLSRIQRFLIVIVILAVFIGPFVYFVYLPKTDKIDKLTKEQEQLENTLAQLKRKAAKLKALEAELKQKEADFKVVRKALPDKEEIPNLLTSISRSGQDSGLEFALFQPQPEQMKDFYAIIPVSLNVNGKYHNVGQFFDKVAQLSRIVNMEGINIKETPKGTDLNTTCTAITYRFVEGAK